MFRRRRLYHARSFCGHIDSTKKRPWTIRSSCRWLEVRLFSFTSRPCSCHSDFEESLALCRMMQLSIMILLRLPRPIHHVPVLLHVVYMMNMVIWLSLILTACLFLFKISDTFWHYFRDCARKGRAIPWHHDYLTWNWISKMHNSSNPLDSTAMGSLCVNVMLLE